MTTAAFLALGRYRGVARRREVGRVRDEERVDEGVDSRERVVLAEEAHRAAAVWHAHADADGLAATLLSRAGLAWEQCLATVPPPRHALLLPQSAIFLLLSRLFLCKELVGSHITLLKICMPIGNTNGGHTT